MKNPPSNPRTHCKHGHSLEDAYRYSRQWESAKTGEIKTYDAWVCRTCQLLRDTKRNRRLGHRARPSPRMPTDRVTLAYAAGVFDGEGTVGIRLLRKKGNIEKRYHSVSVAITSTEPALTDWLQTHFGGRVNPNHRENAARNYKDAWKWQLLARHAAAFLEAVRPYLIVKERHARIALELRDEMGDGRRKPITPEVFARREALAQELRALNRRGRADTDAEVEHES